VKRLVRPLTPYAEALLKAIPYAPDDVPSWQINQWDFGGGRDVSAALQQLKRRGLIVVSPRTTRSGKRWQRPNNMLSVSGERGAEMITPISPAAPRNTEEQLVRLCYRLGRHLLNPDNIPLPTWGRIGQELLAELRDMDTAKYMEAMKPNVQDQPRLAKEKRHEENQEAVACQP